MNYYCPKCGQTVSKDKADCPRCLTVFDADTYPLRRPESGLLNWDGRIGRLKYLLVMLLVSIAFFSLAEFFSGMPVMIGILGVPATWIGLAAGIKRCHDLDRSGWWMFIPFVSAIYMHFFKGTEGINTYGPAPDGYGKSPTDAVRPLAQAALLTSNSQLELKLNC